MVFFWQIHQNVLTYHLEFYLEISLLWSLWCALKDSFSVKVSTFKSVKSTFDIAFGELLYKEEVFIYGIDVDFYSFIHMKKCNNIHLFI